MAAVCIPAPVVSVIVVLVSVLGCAGLGFVAPGPQRLCQEELEDLRISAQEEQDEAGGRGQ